MGSTAYLANRFTNGKTAEERMAGKLTLEEGAWKELELKIANDPVLSNAFRLMSDASMLFDADRYASTVALACLSIEEIGKHLLSLWSADDPTFRYNKNRLHKMKQSAVAALFLSDGARKECRARNIDFQQIRTKEQIEELTKTIASGLDKEKTFANAVLSKALEAVKWSGIYYDEGSASKGIEPNNITSDNAKSVMESVSRAFMLLADERTVAIAKFIFPYLHKPPSR